MAMDVDVVVVGCGLAGSATAWALARRGVSVIALEQFEPHHSRGSSHGSARVVRRAYGDALYTRLAGEAFELWRELEYRSATPLLRMLGGLDFGSGRKPTDVAAHLAAAGVPHAVLGAAEAERNWPGMRFEGDVVFHEQAGTLDAQAAMDAMLGLARADGAQIRFERAVTAVRIEGDQARVELAGGDSLTPSCVVVAVGAWIEPLLGSLVWLPPMRVTQQQVFHFPRLEASAPAWPSVIHVRTHGEEYYHLAGGRDGGPDDDRKVAEHVPGTATRGDGPDGLVDPESRRRVVAYVRRWLPGLDPSPRAEATCLYTRTRSEDFLIDRSGPIVISSPCSGHGAKFAPLIGEFNARLALGEGGVPSRFTAAHHATAAPGAVSL
ncbi:MAG: FAD-dependent oxidoreductase [Actinobacteria bacterium]|nr:FAD-dependent oxidoreductase [Actinomycetota bacterium]